MSEQAEEGVFAGPPQEDNFLGALFCPCRPQYLEAAEGDVVADSEIKEAVEEQQEDPGILWFSFFSDLIFVCVVIKFTEQYKYFFEKEEVNSTGMGHWFEVRLTAETFLFFISFFTIWLELVQAKARFYNLPGAADDVLYFCYLIGIVFMAIQLDAKKYLLDNKEGFILGLLIAQVSMYILHFMYLQVERAEKYVIRRLISYTLSIGALVGLGCLILFFNVEEELLYFLTFGLILLSCFILLTVALVSFRANPDVIDYTASFFKMRLGILVMIIIGESVLAIIIGDKTSTYQVATSSVLENVPLTTDYLDVKQATLAPDGTITVDNVLSHLDIVKAETTYEPDTPAGPSIQGEEQGTTPETAATETTNQGAVETTAEAAVTTGAATDSQAGGTDATQPAVIEVAVGKIDDWSLPFGMHRRALVEETAQIPGEDPEDGAKHSSPYALNKLNYPKYYSTGAFFQEGGEHNIDDYVGVFLTFATLYVMVQIYFTSSKYAEDALCNFYSPGSVWFVLMHIPTYFFLLLAGAGFRLVFSCIHDTHVYEGYVFLLTTSISLSLAFMLLMRFAVPPFSVVEDEDESATEELEYLYPMGPIQIILRLCTLLLIPLGVIIFTHEPIELLIWVFALVLLSWVYDLIFVPSEEEDLQQNMDCWEKFISVCGLKDKEYKGNFTGPRQEGSAFGLCCDIITCRIWEDAAPIPSWFDTEVQDELMSPKDHDHSEDFSAEAGTSHGMFGEFTDLLYVAVVIKFADQMKYKQLSKHLEDDELVLTEEDHLRIYVEAGVFFLAFFTTWLELTHCLTRFKNMEGIFDDIVYFFYLLGVVGMAIQINHLEWISDRRLSFSCWFGFTQMCLVLQHLKFSQIDEAEEYCKKRILLHTFGSVVCIGAGFADLYYFLAVFLVGLFVPLFFSINSYRVWYDQTFSKHQQQHYIERFGLLVMICIGESVLALLLVDFEREWEFYTIVFLAFTTMFLVQSIYNESHAEHPKCHALAEGAIPGALTWVWMHTVLAFSLLSAGVGYKMILPYAKEDHIGEVERYTLLYSFFFILGTMMVIRAAHNKFVLPAPVLISRLFVIGLAPLAAHMLDNPLLLVGSALVVTFLSWTLDYIFISVLQWEVDVDLMQTLDQKAKQSLLRGKFKDRDDS